MWRKGTGTADKIQSHMFFKFNFMCDWRVKMIIV